MPQSIELTRGSLADWIAEIRAFPGAVNKQLGRELKIAAKPVVAAAQRNASWSTRIPGAMSSRLTSSRRWPGVRIGASAKKAPHARLYEFGHDKRGFRHPVFGRMDSPWVQQQTRPFIGPAMRANREQFIAAADRSVRAAARQRGYGSI